MKYTATTAVNKILSMKSRLKIVQGGTSAGKTIAILLILIDIAQSQGGRIISVVSESVPHLKRSAIRDFLNIMESHNYFREENWNRTDLVYTFETGTKIEFFGTDSPDKVRGPRRDILFINECNNVSFEVYTQLSIRTKEFIYLDYNPVSEFWVHAEIIPKQEHDFVILTYKDNEGLPETIIKEIESRKDNKGFWQVYGLGLIGEVNGKIYKDWQIIDELPHEAKLVRRGLDFGYTNDPTAIVDIYSYNGGYILDEVCYQKGMSNKNIADILKDRLFAMTIADSSEPKSIDEIRTYGVNIKGANKGPGSVNQGIQFLQDQRISVTKRSANIIHEYRNYLWETDRNGIILNIPEDRFNHALDATRYGLESFIIPIKTKIHQEYVPTSAYGG